MTPKPMTNIDRALAHIIHAIEKYDWFWPECDDVTRDELFFAKEELELYQQDQAAMERVMNDIPAHLNVEVRYEGDGATTLIVANPDAMRTYRASIGTGHASEYCEGWGDTRMEAIAHAFSAWKARHALDVTEQEATR